MVCLYFSLLGQNLLCIKRRWWYEILRIRHVGNIFSDVAWLMLWRRRGIFKIPTFRQRYPVPLAVEQAPELLEVALPLDVVLDGRGLHEEGVEAVLLPHAVDARAVAAGVDARLGGLHKCIDLLIGGDGGALPQLRGEVSPHSMRQA